MRQYTCFILGDKFPVKILCVRHAFTCQNVKPSNLPDNCPMTDCYLWVCLSGVVSIFNLHSTFCNISLSCCLLPHQDLDLEHRYMIYPVYNCGTDSYMLHVSESLFNILISSRGIQDSYANKRQSRVCIITKNSLNLPSIQRRLCNNGKCPLLLL